MVTTHLVFFGFFPGAQGETLPGAYAPGVPPLSFRSGFSEGGQGPGAPGFPPLSFRAGFTATAEDEWRYFTQPRHNVLLRM